MSESLINEDIATLLQELQQHRDRIAILECLLFATVYQTPLNNLEANFDLIQKSHPDAALLHTDSTPLAYAKLMLRMISSGVPAHVAFGEERAESFEKLHLVWSKKESE